MAEQEKGASRIPQLDGLRGLAILLVLGLHFLNDSNHGPFGSLLYRFGSAFRLGWAGVDLFFILSGFLIGGILLEARGASNYFSVFYLRRLHRIVPIHYLWVTLFVLVAAVTGGAVSRVMPIGSSAFHTIPLFYLFLQNYLQLPFGSLIWTWLAPSWSLGVEEQFYLVAPPLIRVLSGKALKKVLLATVVAAPILRVLVYRFLPNGGASMYVWMPCRADSLAFGVLAAIYWRDGTVRQWYEMNRRLFLLALAVLAAAIPFFIKWMFVPYTLAMGAFGFTWLAMLFTGLLLFSLLEPHGAWASFLRLGFLREMGKLSYCMYLIHLAILHLSHRIVLHSLPRIYDLRGAAVSLFAFFLTYGFAKISWVVFEHPLIRSGHKFIYHHSDSNRAEPQRVDLKS
jgi:peptidoglycan/LPS O-acetylase OafA/YrhL